jgi:hypothetical protein
VGSPHGGSTPEAYTSLAKGQAEVADNYMHLFVPRGAMAARRLTPRYINRRMVFLCQRPFLERVGEPDADGCQAVTTSGVEVTRPLEGQMATR